MDNENTSNSRQESFPEKVDAFVGVTADSAMIERVSHHRVGSDSDVGSAASASGAAKGFSEIRPKQSEDEEEFKIPERFSKNGRRKAVSFPLKLMKILSSKDNEDIIAWLPGGKTFAIKDQDKFTSKILPTHFKQSKYTSFTRKLLRWGFTRIKAGTYTHELFQKGRLDLVEQMSCKAKVALPAPTAFSPMGGYPGFPTAMSQLAAIRQHQHQQMPMGTSMGGGGGGGAGGGAGASPSMQQHDPALAQLRHQDALNAVDREINRVRRLLQEKRLEAATLPPMHHQFPSTGQEQLSPPGRLGGMASQLGMSQSQGAGGLGSIGVMQQPQASSQAVASLPSHSETASQSQMPSSLNPVDIELEVRRRLRLREQGLNLGIEGPSMGSLREPGLGRTAGGIDSVSTLREQGLNRGLEQSSMAASLQRGMMPMSPQQQPQQLLGNAGQWNMPTTGGGANTGGATGGGMGGGMNPNLGFAMGGTNREFMPTADLRDRTGTTPPPSSP